MRTGETFAALKELAEARRLAPHSARYASLRAIAVDSVGKREQALLLLLSAHQRHPNDVDSIGSVLLMRRDAGDRQDAPAYARPLVGRLPEKCRSRPVVGGTGSPLEAGRPRPEEAPSGSQMARPHSSSRLGNGRDLPSCRTRSRVRRELPAAKGTVAPIDRTIHWAY